MGIPLKEQLDNPHPQADIDCEGCHGSGWLTALVDDLFVLEDAGLTEPASFLMSCNECEVFDNDHAAIAAAINAGMAVRYNGLVFYTEDQLEFLKNQHPKPNMGIMLIRIGLSPDGTAHYFPFREATEDYDEGRMPPEEALRLITQGQVTVEVACNDPDNDKPHNYEGRIENLEYI